MIEVLSEDEPSRDLVTKRAEYAQARIPEYWIVDGQMETITVLRLDGAEYVEHATFGRGATLTSPFLSGLELPVTVVFPARQPRLGPAVSGPASAGRPPIPAGA